MQVQVQASSSPLALMSPTSHHHSRRSLAVQKSRASVAGAGAGHASMSASDGSSPGFQLIACTRAAPPSGSTVVDAVASTSATRTRPQPHPSARITPRSNGRFVSRPEVLNSRAPKEATKTLTSRSRAPSVEEAPPPPPPRLQQSPVKSLTFSLSPPEVGQDSSPSSRPHQRRKLAHYPQHTSSRINDTSRAHIVSQTSADDASQSVKFSSVPLPAPSPSASSLLVARGASASCSRHLPLDVDLQQPLHPPNTRSKVDLISSSPDASPSSRPQTPSRATSARAASSAFVRASQLIDRSELRREVAPRVSAKASDGRASGCCEVVEMTYSCASSMEAAPPISQKRSAHPNRRCTTSSAQARHASSSPRTKQAAASLCSSEEPPAARDARRSELSRAVDCQRSAANSDALRASAPLAEALSVSQSEMREDDEEDDGAGAVSSAQWLESSSCSLKGEEDEEPTASQAFRARLGQFRRSADVAKSGSLIASGMEKGRSVAPKDARRKVPRGKWRQIDKLERACKVGNEQVSGGAQRLQDGQVMILSTLEDVSNLDGIFDQALRRGTARAAGAGADESESGRVREAGSRSHVQDVREALSSSLPGMVCPTKAPRCERRRDEPMDIPVEIVSQSRMGTKTYTGGAVKECEGSGNSKIKETSSERLEEGGRGQLDDDDQIDTSIASGAGAAGCEQRNIHGKVRQENVLKEAATDDARDAPSSDSSTTLETRITALSTEPELE
ncbi:hypothetical protein IE81DRAFT_19016 [Ceraceosorus guamensis]|uniref:Uncharacterized protein n=1 Tax=Ceraceosorus guamensis TaxID=1522189 RepID=A0A316W5N4_9BASI|nr:hypothetical protein IE81DRAFT_19016 [Ceraceosorus guamensis]PWN44398.1 hypothetical protein IE81DRAFT_19016 [Ceraceosorus guamensis]